MIQVTLKACLKATLSLLTFALSILPFATARSATPMPGNWMSAIPDITPLSAMSIPGTHDSMAVDVSRYAECQTLPLLSQLDDCGVRFIDIRLRQMDNGFACHHGMVYLNKNFADVLNDLKAFLKTHPTETIVMSVKEEYDSASLRMELKDPEKQPSDGEIALAAKMERRGSPGALRRLYMNYYWYEPFSHLFMTYVDNKDFDGLFLKNPGKPTLYSSIPTMGMARGKIVVVRRFRDKSDGECHDSQEGNPYSKECGGIAASDWTPDGNQQEIGKVGDNPPVFAQDLCEIPNGDREGPFNRKKDLIKKLMTYSNDHPEALCLNFNSAFIKYGGLPYPDWAADEMRPWLINYLKTNPPAPFGILIIDFVDLGLSQQVYSSNFQ